MKTVHKRFLLLLALMPIVLTVGRAGLCETDKGSMEVTVKDPNGSVVIGATVTSKPKSRGAGSPQTTDKQGVCVFAGLAVDSYTVIVEANGFKKSVQQNVEVASTRTKQLTVTLQVGSASETVTVSAESSYLE